MADPSRAVRLWAGVVMSLVVMGCVVPIGWPRGRDSFPLSSYPMFSERRDGRSVRLVVAVVSDRGAIEVLPTEATGHRQLTQAVRALRNAVEAGGDRPGRLCDEVAEWVRGSRPDATGRVGIVTVSYDAVGYLIHDQREPNIVAVHAWCGGSP